MKAKLDKNNIEDIISLTSTQEGMLFHYMMDPNSLEYHEQVSIDIEGDIDPSLLQQAWDVVIQNNEALRTVYRWRWKNVNHPVQITLKNHQVVMKIDDVSMKTDSAKAAFLDELKAADLSHRIDIEKETLRITLCKLSEKAYTMIISNHHILYDGWSNAIIIKELIAAYHDLSRAIEPTTAFKSKFSDYVKWLKSQDKSKQKNYWENYLAGAEQVDSLFSQVSLPEMNTYKKLLSKELSEQMLGFARENGVSLAALLYTVWGILAGKLNNTDDIMFGTTASGRNNPIKGIENMVGLFINTTPLRVQVSEQETLIQLLKKLNQTLTEQIEFESTPLVDINEYAGIKDQSELFNSLVVVENYPLDLADYQGEMLKVSNYSALERTNYNLTLVITTSEAISLHFEYNCFADEQMITRISQYFETIIWALLRNQDQKVVELDILSASERAQLLNKFNQPFAQYPQDKSVQQLFEEQVERTPDKVALVFESEQLTYGELNQKANVIAHKLRDLGVKPGDFVGIITERSLEMVIGIYGIIKSGSAYVPIDPSYPKERINYMLEDCQPKAILMDQQSKGEKSLEEFLVPVIDLSDTEVWTGAVANPTNVNQGSDLLYCIYTSGTTGKPKGVMIEHRNVVSLLKNDKFQFDFNENDVWSMFHSYAFDFSVWEMFGATLNGDKLIIIPPAVALDSRLFLEYIEEYQISVLNQVPAAFDNLMLVEHESRKVNQMQSVRYLIFGGEALKPQKLQSWRQKYPAVTIVNMYGITEITVHATYREITDLEIERGISDIGKAIPTLQLYILNNGNLCGIGIPGELHIAGAGLARGYLNQPELTAAKFIDHPLEVGGRLYKTGDLARLLPDGNVEFLGRIDHQVKIRGFRIELGEIENQILKLSDVTEAVVTVGKDGLGDQFLCAYFVCAAAVSVNELRRHLSVMLPDYMIPAHFVRLEKLPLTPNGKIDRKALPEPVTRPEQEYVAPRNEMEQKLVRIWSEVLGVEKVGINDSFFELGGHSLRATVLISRINEEFNLDEPVVILFRYPSVSTMVKYLNQEASEGETLDELAEPEASTQSRKDKQKDIRKKKRALVEAEF